LRKAKLKNSGRKRFIALEVKKGLRSKDKKWAFGIRRRAIGKQEISE
jgi:hypothetical protein